MYSIYKITNKVNQKVYIGFTNNPKRRWKNHRNCKDNRHLYRAMKIYGKENFEFEILFESEDRDYTLKVMEPYYINLYNSNKIGYNYTTGGENSNTLEKIEKLRQRMIENNPMKNPEIAAKVSEKLKGNTRTLSNITKEKIRQTKIRNKNPNYGKKESANHLNDKRIICENCGKQTNKGNYTRWHGINCKSRAHSTAK